MTPELGVLIPVFNEEASITACLEALARVYGRGAEVIVIDGGHDRTAERVRAMTHAFDALRYVRNDPDLGKGHAIRRGIALARAPLLAQLDADLQFLPEDLPRLFEPLQLGAADLVLGSRFAPGARRLPGSTTPLRTFGNCLTSAYASLLTAHPMSDVLSGIKAWSRAAIERIGLRSNGYSYEVELPMRALGRGLRVMEVPVTTQARRGGASHVSPLRDGARILFDISRFGLVAR